MSTSNHYDAIVVGTGPGGATVAKELSAKGEKVLMLEWGGNRPISGTNIQAATQFFQVGKTTLVTNGGLSMVRGINTGGSSVYYYATAFEPPVEMLKKYDMDITEEVAEIRSELPVAPLKDDLVGPMAHRIMNSARDLGYDWHKLPKFVYQDKCQAECWRCNYGCPHGAKWNARFFVEAAQANGADLINGAKVNRVIVENKKAMGVEYKKRFKSHQVFADKIILGAGGIGSPVILRHSGIYNAGYDYFYDPLIAVIGTVKDVKGGHEFPMATGIHMDEEGYVMTDMTVPRSLYMLFAGGGLRPHKALTHSKALTIMIKAKDSLGGRVTYNGGVRKALAKSDKQKLLKGYDRARDILKNAGARSVFKSSYIAAHPGGTVKVGDIIDSDLKTEYDNLYVCDCSVIPEAWGLPPTFTLLALGKRLAKHLTA
jgi:choline dehydrogenase-like flavoprotein